MLIDLTVLVTKSSSREVLENPKLASFGHLGTHFDIMDKVFPLHFIKRKGLVINVTNIEVEEIGVDHIDCSLIKEDMFVAFYSGFIEKFAYGSREYLTNHPQLSDHLIDVLLDKKISIIGIDFAGVRRGTEHSPKDRYCANKGVFIVENLCSLDKVLKGKQFEYCLINTYPLNFEGLTGLPCRVVAEI